MKFASLFGFCALILVAALALFSAPGANSTEVRVRGASDCANVESAIDEGYGVSRTEIRLVCR